MIQPMVERGEASWVLVTTAAPGDLLAVDAVHRGALAQMIHGKVSRYCLAHAQYPMPAVAPSALAREISHGLLWWMFWHRPLTPARVLQDQGKAA